MKKEQFLYGLVGFLLLVVLVLSARLPVLSRGPVESRPAGPVVSRPLPLSPPKPAVLPPGPALSFPPGVGKIAIVLDDWGYTMKQVSGLRAIRRPVTVAVLPGLPHSAEVAQAARSSGHEVILHMPMEAIDPNVAKEGKLLRTGMPRQQVTDLLNKSLSTVPSARGVSNHQGSKATSDPVLMETVFRDLKRRGFYFLDSYVSNRSVCEEVAEKVKIPFARRAVFLDNEQSDAAIRKQLLELARVASRRGEAIGIGHDRPAMMAVLQRAVPALEKAGYTLVPVSDLAEEARDSRSRD